MALRQTDLHGHASAAPSERPSAPTQQSVGAASLPEHLGYIVRFGLVGGTGVLVNSAVLFALVEGLHWHTLAAATVATETAIVSNFVLNDRWTFRQAENRTGWLGRLWRYNIVALGGLLISLGVLAVLSMGLGVHYLLANLVGIGAATVWNYFINLRVTWALRHGAATPVGNGRRYLPGFIGDDQEMRALEGE